jgi:UDP-N-acetylglucosamine 4,6-dehydratase
LILFSYNVKKWYGDGDMFANQTILITGGTGSWGQELTRQLLRYNPKEVRIFSRNENSQHEMQQSFIPYPHVTFVLGDIRDYQEFYDACENVDYVFHLAALKHVVTCELQPVEAVKTNVVGTLNVIRASIERGVKKVIYTSTDKAVDPSNVYGLSKVLGEQLIIKANEPSKHSTKFICVRGGNLLGSNGSVVPLFKKQLAEGKEITITSEEMTRFFITTEDAAKLLINAAEHAVGGEVIIMDMKACRITDLAEVLHEHSSADSFTIKKIGVRVGERLHESLIASNESFVYKHKEYLVVLSPSSPKFTLDYYESFPRVQIGKYSSEHNLMPKAEVKDLLNRAKLL